MLSQCTDCIDSQYDYFQKIDWKSNRTQSDFQNRLSNFVFDFRFPIILLNFALKYGYRFCYFENSPCKNMSQLELKINNLKKSLKIYPIQCVYIASLCYMVDQRVLMGCLSVNKLMKYKVMYFMKWNQYFLLHISEKF